MNLELRMMKFAFKTKWIAGRMLPHLTEEDLTSDLEIYSGIHRKDVLRTIGLLVEQMDGAGGKASIENDGFCIENDEFCIENEEGCI